MLHQCSRGAPDAGESTWQPQAADIISLEGALGAELRSRSGREGPVWSKAPNGWRRQYIGIVRGGRRFVYGNFFPRTVKPSAFWRTKAETICDGGPEFFGAEYDVDAHRITRLEFNGIA